MRSRQEFGWVLAVSLGLVLAPAAAWAQQKSDESDQNQHRDAGHKQTIRGVVAGVTVEGETMIDLASHRAQTAEMSFLTILGAPVDEKGSAHGDQAEHRDHGKDSADHSDSGKSNDSGKSGSSSAQSGTHRRHNVYVLGLGPKTEIHDATCAGQCDKSKAQGDHQAKAQGDQARAGCCSFEKLEIGDRVEVSFYGRPLFQAARRENAADNSGKDNASARRHGRHRTFIGRAVDVKILAEPSYDDSAQRSAARDRDDDRDKVKDR